MPISIYISHTETVKLATISLICLVSELLVFHTLYSHSEVVGVHIKN